MANTSKRGFASMDGEKQRTIASKGGKAAHAKGTAHEWSSDEARAAGRKGGESRGSRGRVYAQGTNVGAHTLEYPLTSNFLTNAGSSLRNAGNYSAGNLSGHIPYNAGNTAANNPPQYAARTANGVRAESQPAP